MGKIFYGTLLLLLLRKWVACSLLFARVIFWALEIPSMYSWEHFNESKVLCTYVVSIGRILDMLLRTLNKLFSENSLHRFVALIFTFLLVPFESKLVNFSTPRQYLKTFKKSMFHIAFEWMVHISPIFTNDRSISTPKGTKRIII